MIFRALDTSGDWTMGRGKGNYLKLNDAIAVNIKTRILSWVGDCFFDAKAGIDWTNRLGSKGQRDLLEADLRLLIIQSEGVTALTKFDIIYDATGRKFSATYTIQTIYSKAYQDSVTVGS